MVLCPVVMRYQTGSTRNKTLVAALTMSVLSSVALADPAEIEDLIAHGIEFRRAGNDHRALPLLKRAYDLSPTPRTAAQLGLVEMALSYRVDAELHLSEALDAPRDPWVRKNLEILDRSLRALRTKIGEVAVVGTPAGAEVLVNEAQIGRLPLKGSVRVAEGPAVVEVRAPGFSKARLTVSVTGERRAEAVIHLIPLNPPSSPKPELADGEGREEAPRPNQAASRSDPSAAPPWEDNGGALRTVAWVTAAFAIGGIGFGAFESFRWRDKQAEFDGTTKLSQADPAKMLAACGSDEPNRGGLPVCGTLYAQIRDARTLAIVGYSVGGALAIGSAVLFFLSRKGPEADREESMACVPGDSLGRVTCQFHF